MVSKEVLMICKQWSYMAFGVSAWALVVQGYVDTTIPHCLNIFLC